LKRVNQFAGSAAVALSMVLATVSMSSASHPNAAPKPPKLKAGVTLTVWDYFCNTGQRTCVERDTEWKVIQQWARLHHDKVNFPTNPNNHDANMCTTGPTGQGPDLVAGPHNELGAMVKCKTIKPIPAWAWPASVHKKYTQAAVRAVTFNGKQYAMPWAIETTGLFYNKALISSGAFKPAKGKKYLTWSKLLGTFKSLQRKGVAPFGWDQANFYFDYAFISGNGGYVFKFSKKKGYDWKKIGLATPEAVKGIKFIGDLVSKYKLYASSMTGSTALGMFNAGKLAVYYSGPWDESSFKSNNINFGFEPLPSFDGKHPSRPFSGVQDFALNSFSKHPNEAASLLQYLTTHMQLPEFRASGRLPVLKTALNSKTVQKNQVSGKLARAAFAADPMPNIAEMNQVWTPMGNAIAAVVQGKETAAQAARAAVTQIKSDIAKSHAG
jgi:arabinogalactan oligomer/maltooligosaccharide transport system substrate-binding protein